MSTGQHPALSLAELTSEAMTLLPLSARLLAVILKARSSAVEPTRLSLPQIKQRVFPFDDAVTLDSLTLDVLMLEEAGILETFTAPDGRERYVMTDAPASADPLPENVTQDSSSGRIASVGREGESEGAREGAAAPRSGPGAVRPAPPRFCPEHRGSTGAGGESCVVCRDYRMEWTTWHLELTRGFTAPPATPPDPSPDPGPRRPRFRPTDGSADPDDPWPHSTDDLPW